MLYSTAQAVQHESFSFSIAILSLLVAIYTGYASYSNFDWMPPSVPARGDRYPLRRRRIIRRIAPAASRLVTAIAQRFGLRLIPVRELEAKRAQLQQALTRQAALATTAHLQQETLEVMKQRLQDTQAHLIQAEKLSGVGQLVAGVAHDINNPIGFIHGNLVFAEQHIQDLMALLALYQRCEPASCVHTAALQAKIDAINLPDIRQDLPELLASMHHGIDRIQGIVKSLTTYARVDSERVPTDIHSGINTTLLMLRHRLMYSVSNRVPITIKTAYGDLPTLTCAAGHINQVVMNILSNAIDALQESGPHPSPAIDIQTCQLDPDWVRITISDNGPGMPAAIQHKIYDPFFTTKAVGKGTGLGLAISRQIVVDGHGGRLHSRSSAAGTTFYIDLPVNPIAAPV
ncbi:MAG: HAMP domain-containing sensor histidine kinase [Elainellaceae cyanobacterium]